MKSILSFLKSNVLVIALLGVVGYQQTMLTDLRKMHYINNEHIIDTYNLVNDVEFYFDDIRSELDEIAINVELLAYK